LAQLWIEKGYINFIRGEKYDARDFYQRALRVFERLDDQLYLALVRGYLGEVEEALGNLGAAADHYKMALMINRELRSPFAEADMLYHLARVSAARNSLDDARKSIEESLQISETLRGSVSNSRLRTSYFSEVHDRFEFYIQLLMRLHRQYSSRGYDSLALQASERARARTLIDTLRLVGMNFFDGADAALVEREKRVRVELTLISDELTNVLSSSSAHGTTVKMLKDQIDTLSAQYDEIRASLREQSRLYRTIAEPSEFDVPRFQNSLLDDNTLLVEFSLCGDQSFLWLVGKNEISSYVLAPRKEIEERVNEILRILNSREIQAGEELEDYQQRMARNEDEYWQKAQELSNLILAQAVDKIGDRRLIVVGDKSLHYLPLAALPRPQPKSDASQPPQQPIVLHNEIVYQPSANALLLLEDRTTTASLSAKTLLLFADPVFSLTDNRLVEKGSSEMNAGNSQLPPTLTAKQTKGGSFLRLPASQVEAEVISRFVGAGGSTVLTGVDASRENLLRLNLSDFRIVHFATHGFFDEDNPELSGIILAQFDERGNPQNGYLRLFDLYQMSMPVELVVLSACSSGKGKAVRGEGIVGLTRGFMQIGSKSVLSSLWKVDDDATAEIMKHYYEALLTEKEAPAAALRKAQIKMWNSTQWHSPFYWAAFSLHGEFRQPISTVDEPRWPTHLKWLGYAILLAGFILISRRLWISVTGSYSKHPK
jgi:CHAT domain-containing protein